MEKTLRDKIYKHPKGKFTVDENYIIHADYDNLVDITLQDAIREVEIALEVGKGKKVLSLTNITDVKSIEQKARQYYSGPEAERAYKAVALIVRSPVSKMLGNFFIGLNKPTMPLQLFNTEKEGLAWLKGMI